jgi:four helix bundle protein
MKPCAEASLNRKFMEFIKLLNIYLNHFPKHEKYALSNIIRNTAYEVYEGIVEGEKNYYKKTTLTKLDITHEKLRMHLYLAYELGYFSFKNGKRDTESPEELQAKRFTSISRLCDELGKMIGGWIKKIKDENRW